MTPPQKKRDQRIKINSEFASPEAFVDQYVSDLSTSGVFVHCTEDIAIGTEVNMHFTVLDEEIEIIEGIGEVVRIQKNPKGVGIEFRVLEEETMQLIERLVAKAGTEP